MRRVPAAMLAASLWLAGRAAPAQQIPVGLGGVPTSFVGQAFDVPVVADLSGRTDLLGSFALSIRWNPAILAFVRGQDGNFGALKTNVDSAGGQIRLTGANPGGVGGHVVLGVGRFVPLVSTRDTFRINVTELYAARTFVDLLPSAAWSNKAFCPAVGRYGDIDGNATVNSADALAALTYAVGKSITGNPAVGDVDGDGVTGARDALIILAYAVGLDVSEFRIQAPSPGGCGAAPGRLPLQLVPGNLTMDLGQQTRYTAVATDSTGAGVAVTDLTWRSSDTTVARVDSTGAVSAVAPGTAIVRVVRLAGDTGAATVTVMQRHTHWVDAMASPDDLNQLGAPELPFRTIPQALAYARSGDTVRVRSGRYDDTLVISRPVVLMGDTTGGRPRPLIAGASRGSYPGVRINTPGRVELHAMRIDSLSGGVDANPVDTLIVDWTEFRASREVVSYYASLAVFGARMVDIRRSDFFGPGQNSYYYYYYGSGIWIADADRVRIDSTFVADYSDDGVYLSGVDSVYVHASQIRNNLGYGVYLCHNCSTRRAAVSAVFSGNRLVQNSYGHVYLDSARAARFDHNHTIGYGYTGYIINGDTASTLIVLHGDTLDTRSGGWASFYGFDSLVVDSTVVLVRNSYNYLESGHAITVRDSRFLEVTGGTALNILPSPLDSSHVRLRQVEFRGADSSACNRCGALLTGNNLNLDVDSVAMSNFNLGLAPTSSRLTLRHATLQHYGYGVTQGCGYLDVGSSSFRDGTSNGVQLSGCGSGDTLIVNNVTFDNHQNAAIMSSGVGATLVSNSQALNSAYAVYHSCGQLRVTNLSATGGSYGVDATGCAATDTLSLIQSSLTSFSSYGTYLSSGAAVVQNSVFTDDNDGVQVQNAPALVTDNVVIRPRNMGIYSYRYLGASALTQLLRNTVSCDAFGALTGYAVYVTHYGAGDTVSVSGNTVANCYAGMYVASANRLSARANTITLPGGGQGSYGIYLDADTLAEIVGNTVGGPASSASLYLAAVPVARVDSNTVTGASKAGVLVYGSVDSLLMQDNTIQNGSLPAAMAVMLQGAALSNRSAILRRNRIARVPYGIGVYRYYGVTDTLTVQLDSNTVQGADSIGIWVRYYSRARLRYNAVDSSGLDGVRISDIYNAQPAAVLNSNNFTRNGHFGVNNLTAYPIDATSNWWNDLLGPRCVSGCNATSAGDSVSTGVNFASFLTAPFATLMPAPRLAAARAWLAPSSAASAAPRAAAPLAAPVQRPAASPGPAPLTEPDFHAPAIRALPEARSSDPAVLRLEAAARARAEHLRAWAVQQAALEAARRARLPQRRPESKEMPR